MPQLLYCSLRFFPFSSTAFLFCLCSLPCSDGPCACCGPLQTWLQSGGGIKVSFVTQLTEEGVPHDLGFTNRQGFVTDVMTGGHLGQSDHEIIRMFNSQRSKDECQKNCYQFGFSEGNFSLFRRLLERVPWGTVLALQD